MSEDKGADEGRRRFVKLLDEIRAEHGLPAVAGLERDPTYLAVAGDADHQFGCKDLAKIEVVEHVVSA